jgi:hypothetical protein
MTARRQRQRDPEFPGRSVVRLKLLLPVALQGEAESFGAGNAQMPLGVHFKKEVPPMEQFLLSVLSAVLAGVIVAAIVSRFKR